MFNRMSEGEKVVKKLLKFNKTYSTKKIKNNKIIKKIVSTEGDFYITPPFFCTGKNIIIGRDVYMNMGCTILGGSGHVKLGNRVLLGPNVQIYAIGHTIDGKGREDKDNNVISKDVVIEDNVWVGGGSVILPGVRIGAGTTIGAGSVVIKDIPSNVVAAGNPCKVIREITE